MSKLQLGVIFGSKTCEHEISVISAIQLMRAVNRQSYDVIPIYISQKGEWFTGDPLFDIANFSPFDESKKGITRVTLDITPGSGALTTIDPPKGLWAKPQQRLVARIECAIPVFHGLHGEDGTVQGLLELCNIPYASCGVGASALGMDKVYMKQFFRGCGFPVLPDCWFLRKAWEHDADAVMDEIEKTLPYPVFAKPASLGSSIGVGKAANREELKEVLSVAFSYDRKVLVEQGIESPLELNCSVLGYNGKAKASEIEMPVTGGNLLSYLDKYGSGASTKGMASLKRILPAPIEPELADEIRELSVRIFNAMDCKGVVRIDYMFSPEDQKLSITEINTIPGSLAFYLWEATSLPYANLVDELVRCALEAQEDKDGNSFAFTSDILKSISLGGKAGAKNGFKNSRA